MSYSDGTIPDLDCFLSRDFNVAVNTYGWSKARIKRTLNRYNGIHSVSLVDFNYSDPNDFLRIMARGNYSYDAVICPPTVYGFTREVLDQVTTDNNPANRLKVIGCPNDAVVHLNSTVNLASERGVPIINTPGIHARSVAEYILSQIGFHARRLSYFYSRTGRAGLWPHSEASSSTFTLAGKTLGVIGGSGKDGSTVIDLAIRLGLNVISINSGSPEGVRRIQRFGGTVVLSLDDLLAQSDYIAINCRVTESTKGFIGTQQIGLMKSGVIVINTAGAEVFDKTALLAEFGRARRQRRIDTLVLDMPYGGRRDTGAFLADPDNTELKRLGVLFTPRMAGYTEDALSQARAELAGYIDRFLRLGDLTIPMVNRTALDVGISVGDSDNDILDRFMLDIIEVARGAGMEAARIHDEGLSVHYKSDGSPCSNADPIAEAYIRDALRSKGYRFSFRGEELEEDISEDEEYTVIVDGIDGTRNFIDGNYGWCVSIAVMRGGDTVIGVIYDVQSDDVYYATAGGGAFKRSRNGTRKLIVSESLPRDFSFSVGSFRIAGSSETKMQIVQDIKLIRGRGREWGCVALSICAVARGGLGTFIQGKSHTHDHAAGLLIAREAGANIVTYTTNNPEIVDIIVSHPMISEKIVTIFNSRTGRGVESV